MSNLGKFVYGYDVSDILIKKGNLVLTSTDTVLDDIRLIDEFAIVGLTMPNLTSVTYITTISNNDYLTAINLTALTSNSNMVIENNSVLTTLNLSALISTGNFFNINNNNVLPTINFAALQAFGQTAYINDNDGLTSLTFPAMTNQGNYWYIQNNINLTTLNFPVLTATGYWDCQISGNSSLTSLLFPALASCGSLFIYNNVALTTLNFPLLTDGASYFTITGNTALTTLTFPSLITTPYWVFQISDTSVTTLSFPNITGGNQFGVVSNSLLTSIFIPSTFLGLSINVSSNALAQTGTGSVDQILVNIDTAGQSNGVLSMSGGTNATPSATGLTAKANLISKGWTVTTN